MTEQTPAVIKPWYKQFWPWFLIGLLAYLVSFFIKGEYEYTAEVKRAVA